MRRVITCMMNNNPGVLNRFTSSLTARQVNIDSISISPITDRRTSRVTLVVLLKGQQESQQLLAQLDKQLDVFDLKDITDTPHVERELALIKVNAPANKRAELLAMIAPFRAGIIDVGSSDVVIQITGTREKVNALLRITADYGVLQLVRTGVAGFTRAEDL